MSDDRIGSPSGPVIRELIERLALIAHPEGGWYRETWRSEVVLKQAALPGGYPDDRVVMTSILGRSGSARAARLDSRRWCRPAAGSRRKRCQAPSATCWLAAS